MPTRRQRRVSELVHRELSSLLMFQARDPRLAEVTITAVEVTPDLLLARAHFTVLGGDAEEEEAQQALARASGFLRSELARRVRLRFVPELSFSLDKSAKYARRIDELLEQIDLDEGSEDEGAGAERDDL